MKKSELSFMDGFTSTRAEEAKRKGACFMSFDWDKAAEIIKKELVKNPNLIAEAGLQGDWDYTGGVIFEKGKPTNENYTFLTSNWAVPTLEIDGLDIPCWIEENERFKSSSKWDEISLNILGINLKQQ